MTDGGIDLHVHTRASDGTLSPSAAVAEAKRQGVTLLSITDHDVTEGIPEAEAAAAELGVTLVPGVEVSIDVDEHEVHVLGYFIQPGNPRLEAALARVRHGREHRNEEMLARLAALGVGVSRARMLEIAGPGSVGRPHIAAALVEAGHVGSIQEAFNRYLARGKPAYVRRARFEPREAAEIIRAAGGLPVLAHPAKIKSRAVMEAIVFDGMEGVEAFHPDHDAGEAERLVEFARRHSLLVTGGTDTHGPESELSLGIGSVPVPAWVGEELRARAPAHWSAGR